MDGIPKDKALTFARAFSSSSPAFDKTRFVCHVCGLSRTGCRSIVAHLRSTHPRGAGPRLPVYEALARAGPPTRVAAEVITANS